MEINLNKLNLLTCQYELFNMDQNENIQSMFNKLQTILNEFMSLGNCTGPERSELNARWSDLDA